MTSSLVDSNVLIDVLQPESEWFDWSSEQIGLAKGDGDVVLNALIAAEVAAEFNSIEKWNAALAADFWTHEAIPWQAAFLAGSAHKEYRMKGGTRARTLPDFFIGAHAQVKGYRLVTRDARRYRAYFPDIEILAPDSAP